ncbi:MAG: VWA domain-containing protein [Candidatus Binatia bacterium]|nr:VWA domain-containing protein [Candidatus Binatia bacterium]
MEGKILGFVELLRRNGVRVSMAEDLDSLRAVAAVGLANPTDFRETLRATLVKRHVDDGTFDALFDLYFHGIARELAQQLAATESALGLEAAELQNLLELLADHVEQLGLSLSELTRELLQANHGRLDQLLRQAAQQIGLQAIERPFQEGRYAHMLAQAVGLSGIAAELEELKRQLATASLAPAQLEQLQRLIDLRLQHLTQAIKRVVRQELEKKEPSLRETERLDRLGEKSFYYLTEEEIRQMKEAVTKLAERLKNVIAVKRKRAKRGRFDIKDTLRKNLQYGGVPFRIQFDRRVKDKPQIMVLCDVSDSVRNVSRFMLQFVYTLQDLYSRVRSFVFVSELGEVTRLFEEQDIHTAIEQALSGQVINVFAHSDFGRAFRIFHRDFLSAVNKKTTVIILGDARNNYNLPHEWTLRDIRHRAKQLIWLNPENRLTWGFGDSEMDRYLVYCDIVEECRNLNQLYRVIDRIVH